jgi:hypothetical protein
LVFLVISFPLAFLPITKSRQKIQKKERRKRQWRQKKKTHRTDKSETEVTDLKFGADASSRPRHARFVARYESRNKTELICAMVLSEPINMISSTSTHEVSTAATGFPCHVPFTMNWSNKPATTSSACEQPSELLRGPVDLNIELKMILHPNNFTLRLSGHGTRMSSSRKP